LRSQFRMPLGPGMALLLNLRITWNDLILSELKRAKGCSTT
jgi:hypothetical protein